jgi:hypothetical protein
MKRIKESEYGGCTLHRCMNMEDRNLSVILRRKMGKKEKKGGEEPDKLHCAHT